MTAFRFYQTLAALMEPSSALDDSFETPAMTRGKGIDTAMGALYHGEPCPEEAQEWLPQALRCLPFFPKGGRWQGELYWPSMSSAMAEGHPDLLLPNGLWDLKTCPCPTIEKAQDYATSKQIAQYCAAFYRQYKRLPETVGIVLGSKYAEEPAVKCNKDGSPSLTGQECGRDALITAAERTGNMDKYLALIGKLPVWQDVVVVELDDKEIACMVDTGTVLLDAGLAVLGSAGSRLVTNPYRDLDF